VRLWSSISRRYTTTGVTEPDHCTAKASMDQTPKDTDGTVVGSSLTSSYRVNSVPRSTSTLPVQSTDEQSDVQLEVQSKVASHVSSPLSSSPQIPKAAPTCAWIPHVRLILSHQSVVNRSDLVDLEQVFAWNYFHSVRLFYFNLVSRDHRYWLHLQKGI